MLQKEIERESKKINKEAYQMSLGELANLYRDEELDIHPEFQRLYRWSEFQKTRLIESIMLNIPVPQIYVSQNESGVWDVIDGVQRLSTIFQFMGILKDEMGRPVPPLQLQGTEALPSFEGMLWESDDPAHSFTREQQLSFKRSRLDVTIIKKESDANTKYELFQRLNTGGSFLSDQEVRNCLIIMANKDLYQFIVKLSKNEDFKACTAISDRKSDEQYRLELIVKLLVDLHIDWEKSGAYKDMSQLLDKEILKISEDRQMNFDDIEALFNKTFLLLNHSTSGDSFKKYNGNHFSGAFLTSSFEAIAYGVYANCEDISMVKDDDKWLREKIQNMYNEKDFIEWVKPGKNVIYRYKALTQFGEKYFKP